MLVRFLPGDISYNSLVILPEKLPAVRWVSILTAVYGAIWISLEGNLTRVILLSGALTLTTMGHLAQRIMAGRSLSTGRWLTAMAFSGLAFGVFTAAVALLLMGVKTGLHGHGPEFSAEEFNWVFAQAPLWAAAGLLAGSGIGLLFQVFRKT
jgi:hypothetical protein